MGIARSINCISVGARVVAAVAAIHTAALVSAQTWGTYQGNMGHNGFVGLEVDLPNISQIWQTPLSGTVNLSQAAGGNGFVFVSGLESGTYSNFSLNAIDAVTGNLEWTKSWLGISSLTPPALYKGNVYVQTVESYSSGLLSCFAVNGDFGWRQPFVTEFGPYLAPTLDNGQALIAGGSNGGVYAFGALDGTHDWFCNLLYQSTPWTPSLDATYAYNYAGPGYSYDYSAGLYAVNRNTGYADYQLYDANYTSGGTGTPAISGTMCYVTNGGRLVAFDLKRRRLAWQTQRHCTGQPDVVGNAVYAIDSGSLDAFDASTGAFLWSWTPGLGSLSGAFAITNNIAFVSDGTATYGIDLTTHNRVWAAVVGGALSIADGNLYVADVRGTVSAYRIGSLQLVEPSSYQLRRGLALSGNLTCLQSVDNLAVKALPGPTLNLQEAPVQVVVTGVSPTASASQLKLHVQAFVNTPNLNQTIELWNYTTSQWVSMGSTAAGTTESVVEVAAPNPAQFIQVGTGQVQARLSWKQAGPTLIYPWRVGIDQVVWLED